MPEVNWPTVGVCWALTTTTVVVLFVVVQIVTRHLRKRRKLSRSVKGRNVWSTGSEKSESGVTVPLVEMTSPPSRPNGCSSVSSSVSNRPTSYPKKSRTQDDVSRWCSEHDLPESLVYTLREQGFETKAALNALRPEDLEGNPATLRLPNTAIRVQLRQVLTKLHGNQQHDSITNRNSTNSKSATKSTSCGRKPDFGQSFSDSGVTSEAQSPTNSSDVFLTAPTFNDEVDGRSHRVENGKRRPPSSSHKPSTGVKNQQRFNGLLSDKGLWKITSMMGYEWRQLATLLGISIQLQEQLMENHPHKVKNAIYETLIMWRNDATGNKEQIKGTLHKALVAVERNDIANLIMAEQTHGSDNNIQSISSII